MALIDTNRQLATSIFFGRVARLAYEAMDTLTTWNDGRITRKALNRLTNRELDDLGLCRGDIDLIAARGGRRL